MLWPRSLGGLAALAASLAFSSLPLFVRAQPIRVCGEIVGGRDNSGSQWDTSELQENVLSNPQRRRYNRDYTYKGVPDLLLGAPYLHSGAHPWPGQGVARGRTWEWTIEYLPPVWMYIYEEADTDTGLAAAVEASGWAEVDAGEFAIQRFSNVAPMRLWTKFFDSGTSITLTLTGRLVGGASSKFCTTTTSSTLSSTTTTVSSTTTTASSTTTSFTSTWTGSSTTKTTTTRTTSSTSTSATSTSSTSTTSSTTSTTTTTATTTSTSSTTTTATTTSATDTSTTPTTTTTTATTETTVTATETTTTVDPQAPTLMLYMTVGGIDFTSLTSDPSLKSKFEQGVKQQIANALPGITQEWVSLTLSAGSVHIESTISVPETAAVTLEEVSASASAAGQGNTFAASLAYSVAQIEGMDAISTGTIAVAGIASGALTSTATTSTTTPPPEEVPSSMAEVDSTPAAKASGTTAIVVGGGLLGMVLVCLVLGCIWISIKRFIWRQWKRLMIHLDRDEDHPIKQMEMMRRRVEATNKAMQGNALAEDLDSTEFPHIVLPRDLEKNNKEKEEAEKPKGKGKRRRAASDGKLSSEQSTAISPRQTPRTSGSVSQDPAEVEALRLMQVASPRPSRSLSANGPSSGPSSEPSAAYAGQEPGLLASEAGPVLSPRRLSETESDLLARQAVFFHSEGEVAIV